MKKYLSVFAVILISFASLVMPYEKVNAAEDFFKQQEQSTNIYKVVDYLEIGNSFQLAPGTEIYGRPNLQSDSIEVQFGDSMIDVPKTYLSLVELDSNMPSYIGPSDKENEVYSFNSGYEFYSENVVAIKTIEDIDYPVYNNEYILIGNVAFSVENKDKSSNLVETEESIVESPVELNVPDDRNVESENLNLRDSDTSEDSKEVQVEEESPSSDIQQPGTTINNKISTLSTTLPNGGFKSTDKYFRTTEDVPIYDNSTGKLVEVGILKKGQVYPRYESSPSWHLIQYGAKRAYVKKEGTEPASGNVLKNLNSKYKTLSKTITTSQSVTVYDNSSGNLIPFAELNEGQEYTISDDYGGEWLIIVIADRIGYIKSNQVKKNYYSEFDKYFTTTVDSVPVYDNRNGKLEVVGELKKDQSYRRYEASPSWHQIRFGDYLAYVHKENTIPSNGSSIKNGNNNQYKNQSNKITAIKDITVYDNSSGNLIPFGVIKSGVSFPVAHDYGGEWIYILFADRIGYVKSSEVKKNYFLSFGDYFKTEEKIPVYDNRSGKLQVVGELEEGQSYRRYEGSPSWHRIQFGDFLAYVQKEGTIPSNGKDIKNKNDGKYKNQNKRLVSTKDIPVYDNSTGKLVQFGTIKSGVEYTIAHDYGGDWIYVIYADRIGFVRSSDVDIIGHKNTYYDITLEEAVNIQLSRSPQTDKYRNEPGYVSSSYVQLLDGGSVNENGVRLRTTPKLGITSNIHTTVGAGTPLIVLDKNVKGDSYNGSTVWYKVEYKNNQLYVHNSLVNLNSKIAKTTESVNIRSQGSTSSHIYGTVSKGTLLTVLEQGTNWHKVSYDTWRSPTANDIRYYLDPNNGNEFQHLILTEPVGISVTELNKVLKGKGILEGKGQAFKDAAEKHSVNEIYLISHALLETGNGTSQLARGVNVNGKVVYNMFGIGATDKCPLTCGSQTAASYGWDTPEKAIIGGAQFVSDSYFGRGQNTLYKMRWNFIYPRINSYGGYEYPQYATDIGWAVKQTASIKNLYNMLDNPSLHFDIPVYKK